MKQIPKPPKSHADLERLLDELPKKATACGCFIACWKEDRYNEPHDDFDYKRVYDDSEFTRAHVYQSGPDNDGARILFSIEPEEKGIRIDICDPELYIPFDGVYVRTYYM